MSSVTKRSDGNYAIEVAGGPAFLLLTPAAMAQLVQAMRDAGLVPQCPPRRQR